MRRGLIAAVAAAAALAGCGGSDNGGDGGEAPAALEGEAAEQALADAARKTNETTETLEASAGGSVNGLPQGELTFSIEGLVDPETETASMTAMTNESEVELLMVDGVAYVGSEDEAFASALPDGAEWLQIDPGDLESVGLNASFGEEGFSPQIYLALGATDVEAGGEEEIGGDPVRSYSFTIDKEKAVAEAPPESREKVENAITLEGESPKIDGEATIDGEGRMRSFNAVGTAGSPFGGEDLEVTIDSEYPAFGVDVPDEAPPEDEVASLDEAPDAASALQGLLSGGLS
jgi:hypothetical protein